MGGGEGIKCENFVKRYRLKLPLFFRNAASFNGFSLSDIGWAPEWKTLKEVPNNLVKRTRDC